LASQGKGKPSHNIEKDSPPLTITHFTINQDVQLTILDRALIAVQGPKVRNCNLKEICQLASLIHDQNQAVEVVQRLTSDEVSKMAFMSGRTAKIAGLNTYVTRCGYTGEDGFEVSTKFVHVNELILTAMTMHCFFFFPLL